jgi:hypothetical protein
MALCHDAGWASRESGGLFFSHLLRRPRPNGIGRRCVRQVQSCVLRAALSLRVGQPPVYRIDREVSFVRRGFPHLRRGDHPTSAKGLSQARCVLRQWYRLHRGSTQLNPCMHCDEVLCSAYYLQARATPSCVRGSARGCVHVCVCAGVRRKPQNGWCRN